MFIGQLVVAVVCIFYIYCLIGNLTDLRIVA